MNERYFEMSNFGPGISGQGKTDSEITDEKAFFRAAVCCLLQHDRLEDGLRDLFHFLRQLLPLTYIFYMPPYESQTGKHIYAAENVLRLLDNLPASSAMQMKRILEHRARFSKDRICYLGVDDPINNFLSTLSDSISLESPCLYFYFLHEGYTLGSIYFGCSAAREFSAAEIGLLRLLWEPLFFVLRFYHQQYQLEKILRMTRESNKNLKAQLSGFVDIVGVHSGLRDVARELRQIAPFDISVLLTGETGTGKDIFARELHRLSPRGGQPFIPVNCGGIAPSLIDSELFGYTRGAFTGAVKDYKGRFERAHKGTLFLDEIGELPLEEQARLLRVLQERTVERLGSSAPVNVDFRLICATNKDLPAMVRAGAFREDLYFRLAGVTVCIPPLRERPGDIPLLVQHVLRKEAVRYGVLMPVIADGELQKLLDYSWPGNVRELINVVTEAFVRAFPDGQCVFRIGREGKSALPTIAASPPKSWADAQREYFSRLLSACGGRIAGRNGAASLAGLKPNTLRSKLDKLGVPYGRKAIGDEAGSGRGDV